MCVLYVKMGEEGNTKVGTRNREVFAIERGESKGGGVTAEIAMLICQLEVAGVLGCGAFPRADSCITAS